MPNRSVIIVAGGKGLRMGSDLPKQFMPIGGKPVLMHTIEAFHRADIAMQIILVLPLSHQDYWRQLCFEYDFSAPHQIAAGGETRFHSVKNGLEFIFSDVTAIAVHDGVRPFVSQALINKCFDAVQNHWAVVPVVPSVDSLREIDSQTKNHIIDRNRIRSVQTPQIFEAGLLKKAYLTDYKDSFTDDASVVETLGIDIHLTEGETTNIKITTPLDLKVGEIILQERVI